MNEERYLFDVSGLALALTDTPVSERYLEYVRKSIAGEVTGIIPNSVLIGTYHILRGVYNFSKADAERVITNLTDANRIQWYERISITQAEEGLKCARRYSIDGWDGYYVEIARETGATVLTTDDDFEDVDGINAEILLDDEDFERLNEYMASEGLISDC